MSVVEQVAVLRGATVLFCTKLRCCGEAVHEPVARVARSTGVTRPRGEVVDVDERMHQAAEAPAASEPVRRGGADHVPETDPDPTAADAVHEAPAVEPRGTGQATTETEAARSAELPEAEERLRGTPVMAAARAGMLRTSWHVYNTEDDVERVLGYLSGAAPRRGPGADAA